MSAWLRAIGLERYEEGLVHNGWDDLEFLRWGCGWGQVGGACPGVEPWALLESSLDYPAHLSASLTPFYSDITEEDLEEAGVQDPAHKRLLLDTLQLSK